MDSGLSVESKRSFPSAVILKTLQIPRCISCKLHAKGTLGNICGVPETVTVQHQPKLIPKEAPTEIYFHQFPHWMPKIDLQKFIDLQRASDTVNHNILPLKIE